MNNVRRNSIRDLIEKLDDLSILFVHIQDEISELEMQERQAFEATPESLQTQEKGIVASNAADALDEARDTCEEVLDSIGEVIESLKRAKGD